MTHQTIKVKINRFDPSKDEAPYFHTYEVPLEAGMSVLDVLTYIYENLDSSLAYFNHTTCRRGVCVRCTLRVNDKVVVSCQTEVKGDITIKPPRGEIVRDLVVLPRSRK
ncbi:MAG: 2Fe-2S iron-sulfur cluster-binding protein [Candidatus Hodarchaeota archaeon]